MDSIYKEWVVSILFLFNETHTVNDRIGYDLDHYPETWAERKVKLQSLETTPTRTEVLDCYNSDLRVQCHECNIKHIFEGVKGDFAE